MRRQVGIVLVLAGLAACSSGDDADVASAESAATTSPTLVTAPPDTVATEATDAPDTTATTAVQTTVASEPATTEPISTEPPATDATTAPPPAADVGRTPEEIVRVLAADELRGRDNLTAESAAAREVLISELALFAEPLPGAADFEQPFTQGVNLVGVVPGTDLADEYVIVGGHYDHLTDCRLSDGDDAICNGAADNAAGVAAAIAAGKAIAAAEPRRSVIVALWDAEEDGLFGARHYVSNPLVPLEQTVAYVNLDLLGHNLLPSLSGFSLAIGAETGGPALVDALAAASGESSLDLVTLSVLFGQGRSDHAPFVDAGVPAVFLSDATNGCYHSVLDDIDHLDLAKFAEQVDIVNELVASLSNRDDAPEFTTAPSPIAFGDAVELLPMMEAAGAELGLLGDFEPDAVFFLDLLRQVVEQGAESFDTLDESEVAIGAALMIEAFAAQECR